jgi:hypothetical protein
MKRFTSTSLESGTLLMGRAFEEYRERFPSLILLNRGLLKERFPLDPVE